MVPCILRPGLLHSDYLSLGSTNTRPARNTRGTATSFFPTTKSLINLTIVSSRTYSGTHHRLIKNLFRHSPFPLSSLCFLAIRLASIKSLIQLLSLLLDLTQHYQTSRAESIVLGSLHNYSKLLKLHHTTVNMPAQRPSQLPPCPGPPPSCPLPPLPRQGQTDG
jgi:hypothetical protein